MSADMRCPYCGADCEVCHDDGEGYAEDELHQHTCHACDKNFTFLTAIHFTYSPRKANCLNGAAHQFEKTATYPPEFAEMECRTCGLRKPIPKETGHE